MLMSDAGSLGVLSDRNFHCKGDEGCKAFVGNEWVCLIFARHYTSYTSCNDVVERECCVNV